MNTHTNMCTHAYLITLVIIKSHTHIYEQLYTSYPHDNSNMCTYISLLTYAK